MFNATYIITCEVSKGTTELTYNTILRTTFFNARGSAVHIEIKQNETII